MLNVGRVHNHRAVGSVKLALYAVHSLLLLLLCAEAGDNRPALRVKPHRSLGVGALTDNGSVLLVATNPSVLVPASGEDCVELCADFVEVLNVLGIVLLDSIGAQNLYRVNKLERNECRLALLAEAEAVIPVCVQTCGHTVVAEVVHREVDCSLEVVVNRALFAVVSVEDFLIEERDIAAFADVLVDSGEQPERVVCAVGGVSRLLCIYGVLVVFVGVIFLARLVVVLNERQTCAVCNLSGKHKNNLLLCHFGSKVNNALNVLNSVAVAEAVSQTAVLERSRSRPGKRDEAVISVPCVYHIVEVLVGSVDLKVVQLAVPVVLKLGKLRINGSGILILCDDSADFLRGFLTAENVGQLLCFAGLKNDVALKRAAGVGVVVEVALKPLLNAAGVVVASVCADKRVAVTAVCVNLCASKTEEATAVRVVDLVLELVNVLVLEIGVGDEQGVLKVNLVLLVVRVVYELTVACYGKLSGLVGGVCYLCRPNLVGCVLGNVVGNLALNSAVLRGDDGVCSTVAAFTLEAVKALAYRRPRSRPVVACFGISDVDITSGSIVRNAVKAVADNASVCAALYEAVSARVVGDDSSVLRGAEVVRPCRGSVGTGDDILFVEFVEVTVVH